MNNVQVMKRDQLKTAILKLGWNVLSTQGAHALRIRYLAKESGCSIGTVYNVFDSLDEIILYLNVRSLDILYQDTFAALKEAKDLKEGIRKICNAYMNFAKNYPNQWKTLFENVSSEFVPDWYLEAVNSKFHAIEKQLAEQFGLDETEAKKLVGFFWAAIHGITSIMLNKKMRIVESNVCEEDLDAYIEHCIIGMIP